VLPGVYSELLAAHMPAKGRHYRLVEAMLARARLDGGSTRRGEVPPSPQLLAPSPPLWAPGLRRHRHGRDHRHCGDERLVFKACGNRRKTRCPACSDVYRNDARHLVMAGLAGGKGVPESVATHPMVSRR